MRNPVLPCFYLAAVFVATSQLLRTLPGTAMASGLVTNSDCAPLSVPSEDHSACACVENAMKNPTSEECECKHGYQPLTLRNVCEEICPHPKTEFSEETEDCLCKENLERFGDICMEPCRNDQVRNPHSGDCECPPSTAEDSGECRPICSDEQFYNVDTQTCDCPPGTIKQDESCVLDCAANEVLDVASHACICKPGYIITEDGNCVTCGENQVFDQDGHCVCKEGYAASNAVSEPCVSICEPGKFYNYQSGACQCREGYKLANDHTTCVKKTFYARVVRQ